MEAKDIINIIEAVGKLKISHFEMESGDIRLLIKGTDNGETGFKAKNSEPSELEQNNSDKPKNIEDKSIEKDELFYIKSPMVGTCYLTPSPDAKPFAEAGTRVKPGDVVCIIEAMKVMNEIVSEYEGEIAEVLVRNGEVVEYGQPIISLRR